MNEDRRYTGTVERTPVASVSAASSPGTEKLITMHPVPTTCKVLVPDVSFLSLARAGQESEKWIEAPVDWVCEIASPSSLKYDLGEKLTLYKGHGFGEVWVVNPEAREVHASARRGEGYEDRLVRSGRVESSALEGFWLDAAWLWATPLPEGMRCLKAVVGAAALREWIDREPQS